MNMPSINELRSQAQSGSTYIKIAGALWVVAMMIVMVTAVVWIILAIMAGDYYANTKAVRDAAETGTGILSQQGSIEAVKGWLEPFALVGISTFIVGFGFAFVNVLKNIKLRGGTMASTLPTLKALGDSKPETRRT